jgi:RNA polymerase sigma-70 factor (ECF subfamily)
MAAPDAPTDFDLLAAWRGGDTGAGNELFHRHFEALYRFFRNKLNADADDLIQRTFLACVEKRDKFEVRSSFRTFLFGIARYELFAAYRRRNKLARDVDVGLSSVQDLDPSPSKVIAERQEHQALLAALRHLPLDAQIALELYYWENMTAPEIGEVLEVPVGTIRSRIHRGKQMLAEHIQAAGDSTLASLDADLDAWAKGLRAQVGPKQA